MVATAITSAKSNGETVDFSISKEAHHVTRFSRSGTQSRIESERGKEDRPGFYSIASSDTSSDQDTNPFMRTASARHHARVSQVFAEIPPAPASIDTLYTGISATSISFRTAMKLLADCIEELKLACEAMKDGDLISAEDAVTRVRIFFPELFCCRNLGDGYGIVINSLWSALGVQDVKSLEHSQLSVILNLFQRLRDYPFMPSDRAVDEIERLENIGLSTSIPGFEELDGFLDE